MARFVLRFAFAALLIGILAPAEADAGGVSACQALSRQIDAAPAGPVFLPSFPQAPAGPLHNAAFLYDNAAAILALIGCDETDKARRIGLAILAALDNDRFWHDGRLRNAYAAGTVGSGPVKLAGWWDETRKMWLEDRYQVGSDNGNMAWAMLALLALDRDTGDPRFRRGAERIGGWVAGFQDQRGAGGFTGGVFGHEPDPSPLLWKSTEHNTDLAAAFAGLSAATGDRVWRERSKAALHFVEAMWNGRRFAAGSGEDGVTPNPTLALDAQVWPLLALPDAATRYRVVFDGALPSLAFAGGYAYGEARDGVWTEGTAQVALLLALLGQEHGALRLEDVIAAERAPDGGYYATSAAALPTGFMLPTDPTKPRLYFHLSHLGATAWVALAGRRFNPFTASRALPSPGSGG